MSQTVAVCYILFMMIDNMATFLYRSFCTNTVLASPANVPFTSVWAKIAKNYSAQMFLETIKAKYIFVGMKLQADALLVLVFVDKRIRLSPDSSLQTGLYLILGL